MDKRYEVVENLRRMLADVCYPEVDSGALVSAIEELIIYHMTATRDSRYPITQTGERLEATPISRVMRVSGIGPNGEHILAGVP